MARPLKDNIQHINGKFYISPDAAAQLCGASKQSLNAWRKRPDPPPYDDQYGMYPLDSLGEWIRTEQIYKKGVGGKFTWKPDMTRFGDLPYEAPVTMMPGMEPVIRESHSDRYDRLKADKLEMEINERAGTFVLADEVFLAMSSMVSTVKMRLTAIPSQVADTLSLFTDPIKVQEYLEEEIHVALEGLTHDWTKEPVDGDDEDEDDD